VCIHTCSNTGFDRVGHDGLARMVATIRDALDEYHCEIHSMVVEDNKAFCRLRFTGKHVGPLLGIAPTHQTVAWMGATEFTCQNSKILKVWELGDVKSLEEQLLRNHHNDNNHTVSTSNDNNNTAMAATIVE
jgi:predicted ester cyclase